MVARTKPAQKPIQPVSQPAHPVDGKLDLKAMHARNSKRYPRILAELAK